MGYCKLKKKNFFNCIKKFKTLKDFLFLNAFYLLNYKSSFNIKPMNKRKFFFKKIIRKNNAPKKILIKN